jgi:FMN reductase
MKKIVVVNAGLAEDSATARLGRAIEAALLAAAASMPECGSGEIGTLSISVGWVDLRPLARPIADHFVSGFPNQELRVALEAVAGADAVVALTPTYQASFSGLFKSFFDVIDEEAVAGKPVLIGATGGSPRHSLVTEHALRPLFSYLHAVVVPTALFVATEDWGAPAGDSDGVGGERLAARIARAAGQLVRMVAAVRQPATTAAAEPLSSDFPELVDFAELLGGKRS